MKIVFSVASYYPLKDGVQQVTQYQAESLAKMGHEVIVITSKAESSFSDIEIRNGVKILRIHAYNKYSFHFGNKHHFIKTLFHELNSSDCLICVALQSFSVDWILPYLSKIKARKILIMHGMHGFKWSINDIRNFKSLFLKVFRNIRWGFFYFFAKFYFSKFDTVTHLHPLDDSFLYFSRYKNIKNVILYNAFNKELSEKPINLSIRDSFICVANFNDRKNQISLVKSIYNTDSKFKLILLGSKKNKYYYKLLKINSRLSKAKNKNMVDFLISPSQGEILNSLDKAIAFLLASKWEAFPISLLESLARGTPFVSTNTGIIRALVGGVVVNSSTEFIYWINLFSDSPELAMKLGSIGLDYVNKNFSQDKQVISLIEIINNYDIK